MAKLKQQLNEAREVIEIQARQIAKLQEQLLGKVVDSDLYKTQVDSFRVDVEKAQWEAHEAKQRADAAEAEVKNLQALLEEIRRELGGRT